MRRLALTVLTTALLAGIAVAPASATPQGDPAGGGVTLMSPCCKQMA